MERQISSAWRRNVSIVPVLCIWILSAIFSPIHADAMSEGDLTGNGVQIDDALKALRIAVALVSPAAQDMEQGDVSPQVMGKPAPDGKIEITDALFILRKAVGLVDWDTRSEPSPPYVARTSPAAGAKGVARTAGITAVFNEPVDQTTINTTTFTVKDLLDNPVNGTISVDGINATFTPSPYLNYVTTYTATISGTAKDLMGNPVGADYSWSFTTGEPPPTYAISGHVSASTGVALPDVLITASGGGAFSATTTDAGGNYLFTGKISGNYTLIASLNSYAFTPSALHISVGGGNSQGNDFIGTFVLPKIDCQVSAWSEWSSCTGSCGSIGVQSRSRTIITYPANGGQACPLLSETLSCVMPACPTITSGTYEGTVSDGSAGTSLSVSILPGGATYGVMTNPTIQSSSGLTGTTYSGSFNASYQFYGDPVTGTASGTVSYLNENQASLSFIDYYKAMTTNRTAILNKKTLSSVSSKLTGTYCFKKARIVFSDGSVFDTDDGWITVKGFFKIGQTSMLQAFMINNEPVKDSGSYVRSGNNILIGGSVVFSVSGDGITLITVSSDSEGTETDYWVKVSDDLLGGTIAYKEAAGQQASQNPGRVIRDVLGEK